jgi:hypothetical protein
MRMALQATLSVSLKDDFRRREARKISPKQAARRFELEGHEIPPRVNEDQHTVQTHVQAVPITRLLVADAPIFYFSFEFFFNLFHMYIHFYNFYNEQ